MMASAGVGESPKSSATNWSSSSRACGGSFSRVACTTQVYIWIADNPKILQSADRRESSELETRY